MRERESEREREREREREKERSQCQLRPHLQEIWEGLFPHPQKKPTQGGFIISCLKREWPTLALNNQWEVSECDSWRMYTSPEINYKR